MNTETTQKLGKSRGNVNETDNKDCLIEYKQVEGTPFQVVTKEHPELDVKEYYVMFGKYRISEKIEEEEEAMKQAKVIDWWKIMSIAHAIAEELISKNELEKKMK